MCAHRHNSWNIFDVIVVGMSILEAILVEAQVVSISLIS
jgi:hypothetical protein